MHYGFTAAVALFALSTALVEPAVAASDTTPPHLVAFSFTSAVDVSASPQTVTVNATITDDTNVNLAFVQFTGPDSKVVSASLSLISGTIQNGTYRATVTIPRFVQGGIWKASLTLRDGLGNSV